MKKLFFTLLLGLLCMGGFAQEVTIDKENCTITKGDKTFPLHGDIKIVDHDPDITISLVASYSDIEVQLVDGQYPFYCCTFRIVDNNPDIRVKIVEDYPDFEVKIVENYPYIRETSKVAKK